MKQTTLLLFSFTHSRSLNRWDFSLWILTELCVSGTSLSFSMMTWRCSVPSENLLYSAIFWLYVFLQEVMSRFGLLWCSILTLTADHSMLRKSGVSNPEIHAHIQTLQYMCTNVEKKRKPAAGYIRWKTPWTLLVVKVCLWLHDGPL